MLHLSAFHDIRILQADSGVKFERSKRRKKETFAYGK
jgi:hypothetical protein